MANYKVRVIEYTNEKTKKYNAKVEAENVTINNGVLIFHDRMGHMVAAFNGGWVYYKEIKDEE